MPCIPLQRGQCNRGRVPDVDDVVVGDGILGEISKGGAPKEARNEEFKPLSRVPFEGHRVAIGRAIFSGR